MKHKKIHAGLDIIIVNTLFKITSRHLESKHNELIISIQIKFILVLSSVRIETDRRQDFSRINQLIYSIQKVTMLEHIQMLSSIHVNVGFV